MHPRSAQTSVCFYAREIRRKAHDKNMVLNKNLWCEWREPICTSPVLSKWQITVELQDYYTLWTECQLLSRTVLAQQPHSEPGCGNGCQTGASESIHCEVTIRAHYRSTFIHVFIVSDAVAWQHPWNCYGNMPSDVKIDDSEFTSWLCKIEIIAFWRPVFTPSGTRFTQSVFEFCVDCDVLIQRQTDSHSLRQFPFWPPHDSWPQPSREWMWLDGLLHGTDICQETK